MRKMHGHTTLKHLIGSLNTVSGPEDFVSIFVSYSPHNLSACSAVHVKNLERNLVLMIINHRIMTLPKLSRAIERQTILLLDIHRMIQLANRLS